VGIDGVVPGGYVLAGDEPAGRIESVLHAASGDRLVIVRAFSRTNYLVGMASDIGHSEHDADMDLTWHRLAVPIETLLARGTFRREMGRLVPDPHPHVWGAARPDSVVEADLREDLKQDPLTRDGELVVRVSRGVAVLEGWTGTVGGKVVAERLARTTPGVWDAVNRVASDEELIGALGPQLRTDPLVAAAVGAVAIKLGRVRVSLLLVKEVSPGRVEALCRAVPGVRDVIVDRQV